MPGRGQYRYYKRKLYFSTTDRILLHLLGYVGYEGEVTQPDDLTQFGVADAIGLGRSTVSKAIRRLVRPGLVKSARAHVPSGKLRRTVYVLTEAGVTAASKRKREIEEEIVLFRDGEGAERRLRVGDLPKLVPEYATLLDVAAHVSEGVFDASTFRGRRGHLFVEMTDRVPRIRYFFGRDPELAAMEEWVHSAEERVLVISGITGIGKTTLIARKLEDWRGERHLFFHRILEWTTLRNILQQLADFLTRLGKKELAQYLEAKPAIDLEDAVNIVVANLGHVSVVLVYDDYHSAEEPIRNFLYALRAAIESAEGLKLIVAGRSVPPFYDRRDVRVKGTVREISLGGLDLKSAGMILQARNVVLPGQEMQILYRRTGGHPLFLELVDSASLSGAQDIHKYLEEELFSRITDAEAKVLTIASVFRHPVHADALFIDDTVGAGTVRGLLQQSLLREVSVKVYEVHDVVRSFFLEMMTPHERRRYHRWAAQFYLSRPETDALEALYHFVEAGETTGAARLAVKEGKAILKSGRSEELLGLLELLLPAVQDPGHSAELRLLKAHILDVRGELDQAVALYDEIIRMSAGAALEARVAEAHRALGDILRRQERVREAEQHLNEALRLYRNLEHGEGQAETLYAMGKLAEATADHTRAERLYGRALELVHEPRLRALEAELHSSFARLLAARGNRGAGLERKQQALAIAQSIADWHLQAKFQISLGTTLHDLGRHEESMRTYEQGIEAARRIGDLRILAYGLWNASGLYIRRDDLSRAEAYLKEADALFRKLKEPLMESLVSISYGWLWERRGKWHLAKQYILTGLDFLRRGNHDHDLAVRAITSAPLFIRNGEAATGFALLEEGIGIARRLKAAAVVEEGQRYLSEYAQTYGGRRDGTHAPDVAPAP